MNSGTLQNNTNVVKFDGNDPERVGQVKGIQEQERTSTKHAPAIESRSRSTARRSAAASRKTTNSGPVSPKHAKILEQELTDEIPGDELEALNMYLEKQRKRDPFWGK